MTSDKDHKEIFKELNSIKTEDALQSQKIKQMQKDILNIDKKVDRIENKLSLFIEKADEKYAEKKDVERINSIINKITWLLITPVIWAVIALVLNFK